MLVKCFALPLSSVNDDIVNSDQVEYIKHWHMSMLLHLIDIMINKMFKQTRIVMIYYFHAFDCIWIMINALQKFDLL